MPPDVPGLDLLQHLRFDLPTLLRIGIGLVGIVVLFRGAALYDFAMKAVAFGMGALGTVSSLFVTADYFGLEIYPEVVLIAGCTGGAVLVAITVFAHALALIGVGAVTGLLAAVVINEALYPEFRLWLVIGGPALGGILFPLLYQQLLKLFTPLAGALLVAASVGRPGNLYVVGGLWALGMTVQVLAGDEANEDEL